MARLVFVNDVDVVDSMGVVEMVLVIGGIVMTLIIIINVVVVAIVILHIV